MSRKQSLVCESCGSSDIYRNRCRSCKSKNIIVSDLPVSPYRSVDEILEDRLKEEVRTFSAEKVNSNLCVTFPHSHPIAIVAMGDPHLDDKGTAMSRVIEDLETIKGHPHVYGLCVGDITNNWVGRLERLYGQQTTGVVDSWELLKWFCDYIPWLAIVLGNHDLWNSGAGLIKQLTHGKIVQADECLFNIRFKNGKEVSVSARHKWRGQSQWNPAHGISKHAQMGFDYDIIIGGHTHVSAYAQVLGARRRTLSHCIQLASYKMLDSYARTEGFKDHNISPSMAIVIDPNAQRLEDRIIVTYSVQKGVKLLDALLADYKKVCKTQ